MKYFKNAISPVIAVILLLAITVVISMSMYSFLEKYTQSTTNSLSTNTLQGTIKIEHLFSNQLFFNSEVNFNITLLKISDSNGNYICGFSNKTFLEIPNSSLVLHWNFNEILNNGTHNYIPDLSGRGNHGNVYDGNHSNSDGNSLPEIIKSNSGNALLFDGVDDYVEILNETLLENNDYSIILYFKPTSLKEQRIISADGNSNIFDNTVPGSDHFEIRIESKKLVSIYEAGSNSGTIFENNFSFNSYNHYTFIRDNARTGKKYISGKLSNEDLNDSGSYGGINYDNIQIGRHISNNSYFQGEISEFRIYDEELSDEEIKSIYWEMNQNKKSGKTQIDISSCNLQKNKKYNILIIANDEKIESTQFLN